MLIGAPDRIPVGQSESLTDGRKASLMLHVPSWWRESAVRAKVALGVGTVLILVMGVALLGQANSQSRTRASLAATMSQLNAANQDVIDTADALDSTKEHLSAAEVAIGELEGEISRLQGISDDLSDQLAAAIADLESAKTKATDNERDAKDARAAKDAAEAQVGRLMLAYDDDISTAREGLTAGLSTFACDWGTSKAATGEPLESVGGQAAREAFENSDSFAALASDQKVAAALQVAELLGEDPYGLTMDEVQAVAVGCWRTEDARANAVLYLYEDVLRSAALDAACTLGQSEVFGDFSEGYEHTAVFADWELTTGYSESRDYISGVQDRFGSVQAFLAIPPSELEAESDRCADFRSLISPKGSSTWNVGDEIMPGRWNAYDVSDCYWARLAENGDIRDNHFGDALRISVNVLSSDSQFEISGCTFFFPNP